MSAFARYTKVNVETSSAPQIMISLFQAALRNMRASAGAFERGDLRAGSVLATKAANIVLGLRGTLRPEVAPDLCARLSELYTFVACHLGIAGTKFSIKDVRDAERVFTPIAEAFTEAVAKSLGRAVAA
jgi:flagellar biosynthetic protein FliS